MMLESNVMEETDELQNQYSVPILPQKTAKKNNETWPQHGKIIITYYMLHEPQFPCCVELKKQ